MHPNHPMLLLLIPAVAYCLAMIDWGHAEAETMRAGQRLSRVLSFAALSLVGILIIIQWVSAGTGGIRELLTGNTLIWLIQALALPLLIESGGMWARHLDYDPFNLKTAGRRPCRSACRLAGSLLMMLAWTAVLIRLWAHQNTAGLPGHSGLENLSPQLGWPFLIVILILAPILEECLFRHYLLYRLAWWGRRGPAPLAISIILTSLFWALGHQGLLEPYWLKFVQIFGLGIILGITACREGLTAAIVLHCAFNLTLIPLLRIV